MINRDHEFTLRIRVARSSDLSTRNRKKRKGLCGSRAYNRRSDFATRFEAIAFVSKVYHQNLTEIDTVRFLTFIVIASIRRRKFIFHYYSRDTCVLKVIEPSNQMYLYPIRGQRVIVLLHLRKSARIVKICFFSEIR